MVFLTAFYSIRERAPPSSDQRKMVQSAELQDDFVGIVVFIEDGQIERFHPLSNDASDCGEPPRKRASKERNFDEVLRRFERFYFCEDAVYSEADLEKRFRMPRRRFDRIERAIKDKGAFKEGQRDAFGKKGIDPKIKLIPVLRVFAFGMSFDTVHELCEIAESTTRKAFSSFIDIIKEGQPKG